MITAIDTNVLLDVLAPNEKFCETSVAALEESANSGSLVVCDLVYAELCIHFSSQRKQGGRRTRILADFLIGAHAQIQATRLLSRDRRFYRKLFPSLDFFDPSSEN